MVIKQKIAQRGTFLSVSSSAQLNLVVCTKDMHFSLEFSSRGEERRSLRGNKRHSADKKKRRGSLSEQTLPAAWLL